MRNHILGLTKGITFAALMLLFILLGAPEQTTLDFVRQ